MNNIDPTQLATRIEEAGATPPALLQEIATDYLECQRQVFGSSELDAARVVLEDAAAVIASWHPNNALSPSYSTGEWCHWCPFEGRCSNYRS